MDTDATASEHETLRKIRLALQKNVLLLVQQANGEPVPDNFSPLPASTIGNITQLIRASEAVLPEAPVDDEDVLDAELPSYDEDDCIGSTEE